HAHRASRRRGRCRRRRALRAIDCAEARGVARLAAVLLLTAAAACMARASDPIGRLDLEWIAMQAGLKPATRVTVEPAHVEAVAARARREGCCVERAARLIEFPGRPPRAILYLAFDAARASALVDAEAPLLPPDGNRLSVDEALRLHTRLGELLGMPSCC